MSNASYKQFIKLKSPTQILAESKDQNFNIEGGAKKSPLRGNEIEKQE